MRFFEPPHFRFFEMQKNFENSVENLNPDRLINETHLIWDITSYNGIVVKNNRWIYFEGTEIQTKMTLLKQSGIAKKCRRGPFVSQVSACAGNLYSFTY